MVEILYRKFLKIIFDIYPRLLYYILNDDRYVSFFLKSIYRLSYKHYIIRYKMDYFKEINLMIASFPYFLTREKYLQAFEEFENKNNITFFFITPAVNKKDKLLYLGKRLLVDIQSLESPDQLVKILDNIKSKENKRAIDLLKIVSQEFKDFVILFTFLLNSIYSRIFFIPLYMEDIIKITNVIKNTKKDNDC